MEHPATQPTVRHRGDSSPALIKSCRDLVLVYLNTQLTEMFDQAETAMLDFGEKAETNQSQLRFVEAINLIKANRETVEQLFREEISRGFQEFLENKPITYPVPIVESEEGHSLAIVDNADLEEHIAIQNIISKAQSEWFQELFALKQRLAMLRGGKKLDNHDIPGGPAHAATAFQIASEAFALDRDMLLIVYALFDKFVMRDAGTIYENFNSKLIEAGIFPNLKIDIPKQPHHQRELKKAAESKNTAKSDGSGSNGGGAGYSASGAGQAASAGSRGGSTLGDSYEGSATPLGDELFNNIRSMLSMRRRENPVYRDHPEFTPGGGDVEMIPTPALAAAINTIQPQKKANYLPDITSDDRDLPQTVELDKELLQEVRRTLIAEREKLFQTVNRNQIPTADLDTIELVGMLFEEVLNEEALPNIAKALISHLHTPYLKAAVLDSKFLIDREHPIRQLLDLLVDAGCRWIDEEDLRRGIYYTMQEKVTQILSEFVQDLGLFERILEELRAKVSELGQKSRIVETRTQEAARGRERLESARSRAHRVIEEKCGNREIPPALDRFLYHAWLDKMILMLLRNPDVERTEEWTETLEIAQSVITAFDSVLDASIRNQLKRTLPGLKSRIDNGLKSLGNYHQPDRDALFELLDSLVDQSLQGQGKRIAVAGKHGKRTEAAAKKSQRPLSNREKEMLEVLKETEFGTWFDLQDTSGNFRRVKLSWLSPVTRKCMFVDRTGIQTAVIPIETLARHMANGKAKVIKQSKLPFVDRALDAIRTMLGRALGVQPS
jgi:hypothetical protein